MGKAVLKAGIIGGLYGIVIQVFFDIYRLIWPTTNYLGALALGTGGLVVGILYVFGIMQKIEPHGGFGSILPLVGVTSMVSNTLNDSRKKDKTTVIDAFFKGAKPSILMLMSGMIVSMVIARLATNYAVNAAGPDGTQSLPVGPIVAAGDHINVVLELVFSFLIMFVLSAIGQVLLMVLKPTFSGVMGILFAYYVIGAFLACFGLTQAMLAAGAGGTLVSIFGAGEFVFTSVWLSTSLGLVTFTRLVVFTGLIGSMYMWGAIAAVIRGRLHPEEIS